MGLGGRPPRIKYIGPFAKPTGYARACHDNIAALLKAGCDVDIVPMLDAEAGDLEERYLPLVDHVLRDDWDPDCVLVHTIPRYADQFVTGDLEPAPGVKRVAYTTWETSALPLEDARRLDEAFDLVLVPSEFNRAVFLEAGIPSEKVAVIPHAFDPGFWVVRPEWPVAPPLNLLTIGVAGARKNLTGTLIAYLSEFTSADDVNLRVVAPNYPQDDFRLLVARMGLSDLPRVEFLTQRIGERGLLQLHRDSHCYVSTARGEGWGLGAFEAALLGNAVVMTSWGGQRDFLSGHSNFYPVRHQMTPAIPDDLQVGEPVTIAGMTIRQMSKVAPTGIDARQSWAEPDLADLKRTLRWMQQQWKRPHWAPRARDAAMERFTYETVGRQFRTVLEALIEGRSE